ncbi:MAG: DEAD/DEAH box helicase [Candidatus Dormibacteria bacterium]
MTALPALLAQLPSAPAARGRAFERICKWYLVNDPKYRLQLERVWLWNEWPGRFGPDAGIDLVAAARDGGLWAIQAKAYDPTHKVTKSGIDSFLSESGRPQFTFRLLIATTNLIGAKAEKTLDEQAIPAGFVGLSQLEAAEVEWPQRLDDLQPRALRPKQPRQHSREAIAAVCSGFRTRDRGQLVMACGTGKTLVGLWVSEELGCERTLVLVPSLSLLGQTLREWARSASNPFSWSAICSDPTVGDDDLVEHTSELGFPVTTDPSVIAASLSRRGRHVAFATYQSSPKLAEAFKLGAPAFDLTIADEAHRCAGVTEAPFSTVLDSNAIRSKRRLFMTATPRLFTDRVKRDVEGSDRQIASMDDEERFGPVFHRLGFGDAIARGLLSDYRVVILGVDDATIQTLADRGTLVAADGLPATDARTLAGQIGVAKAMRDYDLRRVVTFHRLVSAAHSFAHRFPSVVGWMPEDERPSGVVWAEHVSGAMSSGHRDTLLGRLRDLDPGAHGMLSNARCLGEGVDVPAIDGVAFIDPRRSVIDIVQAVGRAIRRSEEKVQGTVVLPVLVDPSSTPEEVLESSSFQPVWEVVRALRAHDEILGERLDELRREIGRLDGGAPGLPTKILLDLPVTVGDEFVRALQTRLVENTTARWEQWFGSLQSFVEREGHSGVPIGYTAGAWRLGSWVATQRKLGRRGDLLPDRRRRLGALPGWSWNPLVDHWPDGFGALQSFARREGHASVPKHHVESGVNLGTWVQHQRTDHRKGTLASDRAALLEAIPGWVWNTKDERWAEGLALLQRFKDREGHARVPDLHYERGFPLGHWVRFQRQRYDRGELSPVRQAGLESIEGWIWDDSAERWDRAYALLEAFVAREGHALVPQGIVRDGVRLGAWVSNQRMFFHKGRLPPDRVHQLEALAGWSWDAVDAQWEANFTALRAFAARTGNVDVPKSWIENGARIGWWIGTQRQAFKRGSLDQARATLLEGLPGWSWDKIEAKWEAGFASLTRFVEREGEASVPVEFVDEADYRLGQWTAVQRRRHALGKLSEGRRRRLEALPGWSWNVVASRQQSALLILRRFVAREGHARVPAAHVEDGFPLGAWVAERRRAYRRGKLDQMLAEELIALPDWRW